VRYALELGYRLIDTASAYGNETDVGAAVEVSGVPREELFITTKAWIDEQGKDATVEACRRSLARLGLDYLDLYLIHWPAPGVWPQAWEAMLGLLQSGECRAIGVSNFGIHHLEELLARSPVVPAVNQVEFNPFFYRKDLLDYCREKGIRLESYGPLTRGAKLHDPRVAAIADAHGKRPAQVLLRWAIQHGVVPIPKSVHAARIRENSEVFDFELAPEEMGVLDSLNENYSFVSPAWREQFA